MGACPDGVGQLTEIPTARDGLVFREILPSEISLAESTVGPGRTTPGRHSGSHRGAPGDGGPEQGVAVLALDRLGICSLGIDHGEAGEPLWPMGVIGSITHVGPFHAAAAAHASRVHAIGIDAVRHRELPESVRAYVRTRAEAEHLLHLSTVIPDVLWDCVLFGAKEAVYKAQFPITRQWLEFGDVEITFSPHDGQFSASVRGRKFGNRWKGQYRVQAGIVAVSFVCRG